MKKFYDTLNNFSHFINSLISVFGWAGDLFSGLPIFLSSSSSSSSSSWEGPRRSSHKNGNNQTSLSSCGICGQHPGQTLSCKSQRHVMEIDLFSSIHFKVWASEREWCGKSEKSKFFLGDNFALSLGALHTGSCSLARLICCVCAVNERRHKMLFWLENEKFWIFNPFLSHTVKSGAGIIGADKKGIHPAQPMINSSLSCSFLSLKVLSFLHPSLSSLKWKKISKAAFEWRLLLFHQEKILIVFFFFFSATLTMQEF